MDRSRHSHHGETEQGRDTLLLALKYNATDDDKQMLPLLKELPGAKVVYRG
jgi:hypothetical protein